MTQELAASMDEALAYVIIMEDKLRPGQLRAAVTVLNDNVSANRKALQLAAEMKVACWVMAFPDPRKVANG